MTRVSSIHLVIALVLACGAAQAVGDLNAVPGEKLDSGLGNLPRYSQWKGDPELSRFVAHDGTEMVRADAVIGSR